MSVRNTKAITRLMYPLINGDSRAFITEFCWGLDPAFMPGLARDSQGSCLPLKQLLAWLCSGFSGPGGPRRSLQRAPLHTVHFFFLPQTLTGPRDGV